MLKHFVETIYRLSRKIKISYHVSQALFIGVNVSAVSKPQAMTKNYYFTRKYP